MPGRLERHASGGTWGTNPPRSAELAAAASADPDPARRAPAPKDTRFWCRGKIGRLHVSEIIARPYFHTDACKWSGCDLRHPGQVWWQCIHEDRCRECGKILRQRGTLKAAECPEYPGWAEQKAQAEAEAAEYAERRAVRSLRRVITGRQAYRRKRAL